MFPKVFLILSPPLHLGIASVCKASDPYSEVVDQFLKYTPEEFHEVLARQRPPRVDPALAAQIVATLPKDGEVKHLTVSDLQKISAISEVQTAHGRERGHIVRVVDVPQVRVGLYARFVILITERALRLLSTAQLQAVVAHEIGHEYVWKEYEAAQRQRNQRRLRELELFCDGVALVTLSRIGADPAALTEALRSIDTANRRSAIALDENSYPTMADRAEFAERITKWLKGGPRGRL